MSEESASERDSGSIVRRWSRTRNILAVLLAIQILFLVVGLAKAKDSPSLRPPQFDRFAVAKEQLPLALETGFAVAQQYAQQWMHDARLVAVSMHLNWPDDSQPGTSTDLPRNGFLLYIFVAGDRAITISLDRGSGNLNGAVVSEQGGSLWKPLDMATYTTSATIAGITADLVAGKSYRDACPDLRHESDLAAGMQTAADGSIKPIWTIVYQQERHNDVVDVRIRLDASSGAVIEKSTTSRGCND